MERLANLPTDKNESSPAERDVMKRYFDPTTSEESSESKGWLYTLKLTLAMAVLFVIFINPWFNLDPLITLIPYVGESPATIFSFKVALFCILFVVISKLVI